MDHTLELIIRAQQGRRKKEKIRSKIKSVQCMRMQKL